MCPGSPAPQAMWPVQDHVVQSSDGYLYAATERRALGTPPDPNDATSGVIYRIEPAN